jgi:hypothetical protein
LNGSLSSAGLSSLSALIPLFELLNKGIRARRDKKPYATKGTLGK